ncbi:uncharacterized protein LOC110906813 [Helianthus annuus]|uniref:uncharacterized protein LOC110906813 n=1 Tax=Helianthus annuus TaxID=4232 RepID=UPI000B8FDB66|nr:uncharacterized protein LOC110906813 [Helianthus annuus]
MGFPPTWRMWILGILESSRASVLINGSPTLEFQCYRGVRQGDSLSPFIFIIAMEALTNFIEKAKGLGLLRGIHLPNNGPSLTHLMYADDVVFMGEWGQKQYTQYYSPYEMFPFGFWPKINYKKSNLFGIGVAESTVQRVASLINCNIGKFPFKYLGLLVGANMNQLKYWKGVSRQNYQNGSLRHYLLAGEWLC